MNFSQQSYVRSKRHLELRGGRSLLLLIDKTKKNMGGFKGGGKKLKYWELLNRGAVWLSANHVVKRGSCSIIKKIL